MSFAIYATPRMLLLAWLGLISGLPLALTIGTMTAWLSDSGIKIEHIGLFAYVGLPYVFKFAWAPLLDGFTPPLGRLLGKRRAWMLWWLLAMVACIIMMASFNPTDHIWLFAIAALGLASASASFDISLDAFRIEWLSDARQGEGAAMAVLGYRIGMIISSAGALYLAEFYSWELAYVVMAGILLSGALAIILAGQRPMGIARQAPLPTEAQTKHSLKTWLVSYLVKPFKEFATRPNWWLILLFITLFKLGDAVLGFMTMPFLISEVGYSKSTIAEIVKIYGLLAAIGGGLIGGWYAARYAIIPALFAGGLLQALANLPYAYLAILPNPGELELALTIIIDNAFGGFGTTIFIAYLSRLCHKQFSATQYALLNSLTSIGRTVVSGSSGVMVAAMGWPLFFIFTTLLGLPSLVILWILRRKQTAG